MKNSLAVFVGKLAIATLLTSCNSATESKEASTVTTGFTMTGSGQNAVAQSKMQKLFSLMVPSAYALTPPLLVDSSGANITLDEAWIVIEEIEFEANELADGNELDGDDIEFEGPFFVDLLSNAPISFGEIQIPAQGLRRVKMQLHESNSIPVGAPIELNGKSIYLSGMVNGIPFSYSADDSTEFEISGPNAIVPESSKDLLAVVRTADLIKKINLSTIIAPTSISTNSKFNAVNPCPLIDPSASDLYTCFRKGLASEADFGKDDGDMDLDDSDESVDD